MRDLYLKACRLEATEYAPVWFMRQAGRYQAAYRRIREKYGMLEMCQIPEVVTQVTLLPIQQFDFDAAILFSDITIPFLAMDVDFDIEPAIGPVVDRPIRSRADIDKLRLINTQEQLSFIPEAIRQLTAELKVPLIGFAGAPFTLSAYLIEGKPSRDFKTVRKMMYSEPAAWHALMSKLTDITIDYLSAQARAGASALQIFDSWVGGLHPAQYEEFLLPHMQRLFSSLAELKVPLIHFGTGTALLLPLMRQAGGQVIGVDWKTPLDWAWETLGYEVAVQGNLDPAVLLSNFDVVKKEVSFLLDSVGPRAGHIFNLGHGIWPETDENLVAQTVEFIREYSRKQRERK